MNTRQFHNHCAGFAWVVSATLIGLLAGCKTPRIAENKEAAVFENIAPRQAQERLSSAQGYRYVDVRTVEEFSQGHADGAVNIPVSHRDPATGKMIPNPDFLSVMQKHFKPDAPLILGCRSGVRSATAARMLTDAGFNNVYNLTGGYVGAFDMAGQCTAPGWSMQGLPTSTDNSEGVSYESLRKKP